jgi:hypothetical protein
MSKELKKDRLYVLELEYDFMPESGNTERIKETVVGYVRGTEKDFFYGSCFTRRDDGRWFCGETMSLSVQEFNEKVKSFREL